MQIKIYSFNNYSLNEFLQNKLKECTHKKTLAKNEGKTVKDGRIMELVSKIKYLGCQKSDRLSEYI
jgi:hypothetical protein